MIDKDSLPLDKPRRTPDHPTKSHVVKTRVDGKEKIIRFGEQGAKTAGKPKEGESEAMKQKRASFKARHAKNIAKGKSSPAFWADKVKWATGGSVDLEDLDEKYEGIKKPDFTLLESFRQLIRDLQARAEESGTQEFDPLRALGRSGAAESLEDLYASYADRPRESHARRAEAGAEPVTEADMGGISPAAQEALAALRASWSGPEFDVISGYRDPERNKRVGGAKGSQHLHGNAFDINTAGWTPEEKLALADAAYDAGFRGFGFYNNNLHFDVASPRAWGPSYKRESVPLWAQDWVAQRFAEGGLAELAHKYDRGGKKKDDEDELARAVRLRDLELMAEPKNPNAVPAEDPRLLNVGGLEERLAFLNQTLNPVEAIGDAMSAGRDLMASDAGGYDRLEALGRMLSGVAGVAGPAAVAKRVGAPAANAVADMARKYAVDETGSLPGMGSGQPERFGENWDDVYHWSRSPEGFSEFDPDKSKSAMSQLGPHVGTQGAAEARYMGFANPDETPAALGFTMPLKADLSKPFLNPATGKPWTEMDLEMFISAVSDVNNIDRKLVAPFMRERLAKEGYTSIPYMNDVEDAGSVSHIMLTERPASSDAVLRSRFAKFDPAMRNAKNLSAGVAAGAIGASQYDPDAIETTAARVRENKFAAGGAVKYDPGAVDRIITKLREVNRG